MSLPANELLSPFCDGELSAAERVIVEQQLATNATARRELSEIRQVSALLKGLPRETLPPEFPQQVLQGIEREMLIPSDSLRQQNTSLMSASRKRSWSVGAGAVLTSAAALLLLVRAVDHERVPRGHMSAAAPGRNQTVDVENLGISAPMAATAAKESLAPGADVADRPEGNAAAAGSAGRNSVVALGANRAVDNTSNLYLDQSALRLAEIGDVVEALQTDGDDVAVVRLTVVDRQKGLEKLQILLTKNRIARVMAAESEDKGAAPAGVIQSKKAELQLSRQDADKAADPEVPEQMLAVFVESDSEHLAAALRELRETKFVQSLEVESPISLAQLDEAEHKPAESAEKAKAFGSSMKRSPSLRTEAEKLDRKSGDNTSPPAKSATTSGGAKDVQSLARQYAVQLPADALPQTSNDSKSRSRENMARRGQSQSRFKSEQLAEQRQLTEQRPMQVLFVVVDQAAASKPAAPATSPKASAPAKTDTKPSEPQEQDGAA